MENNNNRDVNEEVCEDHKKDVTGSTEDTDVNISCDEEELKKQLEQLEKERDEHLALAQRVQADFDNFRKRNKNISAEFYDSGVGDTVATFLPVLDNLERALCSMEEGECSEHLYKA